MSDWQRTTLGEVTIQVSREVRVEDLTEARYAGVRWYVGGVYHRETVPAEKIKGQLLYRIKRDDIVYNRMWATKASFGVVKNDADGCFVTNDFPVFTVNPEAILPAYAEAIFHTASFQSEAAGRAVGTTERRRLHVRDFANIPVVLPPLPVQERIVEVIGGVDDQIAALGTESEALEGILDSLRSDLPKIGYQPIGDVLLGIDSGKSVQAGGEASAEDEYRILKLSAVQRGWFKPSEAKALTEGTAFSPSHVVKNGDLLITRANTPERVGFVAVAKNVVEGTFMPDLIWRLRVDESRVSTDYLEHALSSRELRTRISAASGGTSKSMVKINKRGFGTVRVPIPPLPEQVEYVRRCDAVIGGIKATRAEEARLRKVRAGLLSGLLDRTIEIESAKLEV